MSTSNLCCIQPEERIDSPEPPARPLAAIDGIFAAAALPEDHPHALKIPGRKAATDTDIVRSPSITNKIKLQFRRSSLKDLKRGKDCDDDARAMTLKEILDDIEMAADSVSTNRPMDRDQTDEDVARLNNGNVTTSKRSSVNFSLPLGVADKTDCIHGSPRCLTKSISSPILLSSAAGVLPQVDPSFSNSVFGVGLFVPKQREKKEVNEDLGGTDSNLQPATEGQSAAASHHSRDKMVPKHSIDVPGENMQEFDQSPTMEQMTPLHQMDISQQLRSMSQMSNFSNDEASLPIAEPWSFHGRERSNISRTSKPDRHSRQMSSSGIDSASLPAGWGRVGTPVRSNASSLYSRPGSAEVQSDKRDTVIAQGRNPDSALDCNAHFADWPLKSSPVCHDTPRASATTPHQSSINEKIAQSPHPSTQTEKASQHDSSGSAPSHADRASVQLLSPPPRASSIPSKSSSSTLTKASMASRFLERFSPPKRMVRKRKSIFKFLRPGSRKQQDRSISSPALHAAIVDPAITLDGPSDDPALLTVQYELTDHPNQVSRSMSMNQLGATSRRDTVFHITPPQQQLQRQPTLAEYEKSLTVAGDDRRRPSTINIERAKEIHEDDRRDSSGLRKRLSRAHPLQDAASPLMAQALAKHQQEKALFRSASKPRAPAKGLQPEPVFNVSAFGRAGGSLPPQSLRDHNDLLDPLEKGHLKHPSERGLDAEYLHPHNTYYRSASTKTSPSPSVHVSSTSPSVIDVRGNVPQPQAKKRIGTNLESWSRYPSYSRSERCGSAGLVDNVITRDFAVDVDHEKVHVEDENNTNSNNNDIDSARSKRLGKSSGQRSRFSFPRSGSSSGFGGIMRYYSNLFHTRGWYGQNRRTSITTGGKLEYPELEMLPPQMAESPHHHRPHHHIDSHPFHHLREQIEKDTNKIKTYVRDEEAKIGGFVRDEERKFEDFMRNEEAEFESLVKREEQKLGEFVKREEGKLRDFVKEEEDWFSHGGNHRQHRQRDKRPSSEHSGGGSRKNSPFRAGSIFEAPSSPKIDQPHRTETTISPDDTEPPPTSHDGANDEADTAPTPVPARSESVKRTQSKAEIWSDLYKDLLSRPISPGTEDVTLTSLAPPNMTTMLKPVPEAAPLPKPRPKLDPQARIRRFPSVTVVDDRKGHVRSVSLISVEAGRSVGVGGGAHVERENPLDLLEMIRVSEQDERERLRGSDGVGEKTAMGSSAPA